MNYNAVCYVRDGKRKNLYQFSTFNINDDPIYVNYGEFLEDHYEYDNRGNLICSKNIIFGEVNTTRYEYDENNYMIHRSGEEYDAYYTYTNDNRLLSIYERYNRYSSTKCIMFDSNGSYMEIDEELHITLCEYDEYGNILRTRYSDIETRYEYDESYNMISWIKRNLKTRKVIDMWNMDE